MSEWTRFQKDELAHLHSLYITINRETIEALYRKFQADNDEKHWKALLTHLDQLASDTPLFASSPIGRSALISSSSSGGAGNDRGGSAAPDVQPQQQHKRKYDESMVLSSDSAPALSGGKSSEASLVREYSAQPAAQPLGDSAALFASESASVGASESIALATPVLAQQKRKKKGGTVAMHVGDLFDCPANLAHCISADVRLGKGIAKTFVSKFGGKTFKKRIYELKRVTGQCATLLQGDRYIYNLVTKPKYFEKPTYDTLRAALIDMREHAVANKVTRIAMPKIGCGLDKLKWNSVKIMLEEVFDDTNISIDVYELR